MKTCILILSLIFAMGCKPGSYITATNKFKGLWKLQAIERKDTSGKWQETSLMKGGTGYIIYDGQGHMAVQMTPAGYKDFTWLGENENSPEKVKAKIDSLSVSELKTLLTKFSSGITYFANYKINEDTNIISHTRISNSNPSGWNTKVDRTYTFRGDTLILQLPGSRSQRLIWIKQK
jgi:hypothetical protein